MPFDFADIRTPFRMQPGLRRLQPDTDGRFAQLTPNRLESRVFLEKMAVLVNHPSQALLTSPGFDPWPALQGLAQHAAIEHPDAWTWDGGSRHGAPALGWHLTGDAPGGDGPAEIGRCLRALAPEWRLPALLSLAFAEDFAVIDGATGRIPWLAVCLPSHWAPEEKIGRHFAEVHAPVADNQLLITASDHLARLVTGDERWERFVWTVTRQARLHTHPQRCDPRPWPADADADALAAIAFFRTERQTFIPLPAHREAVFTIHVEVRRLDQAITSSAQAKPVHDALASMSPAVLEYRGLTDARDRLLDWLRRRTDPAGPAGPAGA